MNFFKQKFNKDKHYKESGLTMVETLVAISILTIAVIGPLGIIAQALHTSYYTRDQMTAYYLAQEAIENIRHIRDNRGLDITSAYSASGQDDTIVYSWLQDVLATTSVAGDPRPQVTSYSQTLIRYSMTRKTDGTYKFTVCSSSCDTLKVSNGIYGIDPSTPGVTDSPFRREIYFQAKDLSNPQEFRMIVNVYWKNGAYPAKLTLEEYFTNWTSKTGS